MWRDRLVFNPLKTIACIIAMCLGVSLIITGLVGAIWGTVEVVKQVGKWVL